MASVRPLKIVIFGPYKTGTTGLYYKISNSFPGKFRGIFEQDHFTQMKDDTEAWILAKTIAWYDGRPVAEAYKDFMNFDRKVFLIRDPRDWIISALLFIIQQERSLFEDDRRMAEILGALCAKEEDPRGRSLISLLELILGLSEQHDFASEIKWMGHHYRWLPQFEKEIGDHLVVRYEDFIDGRLEALEAYLGLSLTGTAQVDAIHSHVPRTKGYGNWRHWLTEADVDFLKPFFQDYMSHFDYLDDWTLDPCPRIDPEHCTQYVVRTINKRRGTPLQWP